MDNLLTAYPGALPNKIDFLKMITEDSKLLPVHNSLGFLIHDMISEIVFHVDAGVKSTEEFSIERESSMKLKAALPVSTT